jgi:N-methylhydantoinase A
MLRVGVDTGGTFTDLVALARDGTRRAQAKVPSTPADPAAAVLAALERAGIDGEDVELVVLGTTIGTNALLERRGATVAYLTTEGFEDVPFIGRGNRPHHYDLTWVKPRPLIEPWQSIGVPERIDANGAVARPLDARPALDALARLVEHDGVDAVAVNLLFSYVNGEHERRLAQLVRERFPGLPVSLSHEVAPVWREFERGVTTIADAYLKPVLGAFVDDLRARLREHGVSGACALLLSNGGTRLAEHAARAPVQLLLSGLAGGVIAGRHFGAAAGEDLITLDMGGTSCDVAVVSDGRYRLGSTYEVEFGVPLAFPAIELTTIGAGGGSVARVDRAGLLRVGPHSAGAEPGPACYGRGGTEPTVTDADAALGRLSPDRPLAGAIPVDAGAALAALGRLGASLGLSARDAALATVEVADATMGSAIALQTVEVGIDPRRHALVAFGGAGPLHAGAIARRLGIPRVLVPPHPGLCSAFGALAADLRSDQVATVHQVGDGVDAEALDRRLARMRALALEELVAEGLADRPSVASRLALRYAGQNYEHEVEVEDARLTPAALADAFARFESRHDELYGYQLAGEAIEVVSVAVTATGRSGVAPPGPPARNGAGPWTRRKVTFADGEHETAVIPRGALAPGDTLEGPAVLEEHDSTTLLHPGDRLAVLADGSLSIQGAPT